MGSTPREAMLSGKVRIVRAAVRLSWIRCSTFLRRFKAIDCRSSSCVQDQETSQSSHVYCSGYSRFDPLFCVSQARACNQLCQFLVCARPGSTTINHVMYSACIEHRARVRTHRACKGRPVTSASPLSFMCTYFLCATVDLITYAIGIGSNDLRYIYEKDVQFAPFPTFVTWSFF